MIDAVVDLANRVNHKKIDKEISELFLANLKYELADRTYEVYRDSIRAVKVERNRLRSVISDKTNGLEAVRNQVNEQTAEYLQWKTDVGFGNGSVADTANLCLTLSDRNDANKAAFNPDLPVRPYLGEPTNPEDDGDHDDENTIYDHAKYEKIRDELLDLIGKTDTEKNAVVAGLVDRQKGYQDTFDKIKEDVEVFGEEWTTLEALRDDYKKHTLHKIQLKNLGKAIETMKAAL